METYEATILTIVTMSSPLIFAVIGETISERVGIVNLSMEGNIDKKFKMNFKSYTGSIDEFESLVFFQYIIGEYD